MSVLLFLIIISVSPLGVFVVRKGLQLRMDMTLKTYELTFPLEMSPDTADRMFVALAGLFKPIVRWPQKLHARPTVVFELLGTPNGIQHLISFPPAMANSIRGHLLAVAPNIGINEFETKRYKWKKGVEVARLDTNETKPDPMLVPVLLSAMRDLADDEAVMVQFVLTPSNDNGQESEPFFLGHGRIVTTAAHPKRSDELLKRITSAYRSLQVLHNHGMSSYGLTRVNRREAPITNWSGKYPPHVLSVITGLPMNSPQVPGLVLGRGRRLVAAAQIPEDGIKLGNGSYPGKLRPVGIKSENLLQHLWALGGTGSGKSTLLHGMATQIMNEGHGLIVMEPKADLARAVLSSVPKHRTQDVIWFDPTDEKRPIGLNVLQGAEYERTAANLTGMFKSLYGDSWGPRLEQILRYSILTAAMSGLTLYDVKQLLVNADFRNRTVRAIKDPEVRQFWRGFDGFADNAADSVVNKLDAFVGFRAIRNIVGQTQGLDMREVVSQNKILLIPLNEAMLGEKNAEMLGSLMVSQLWGAARTRQNRDPFFFIMDEVQRFMHMSASLEDAFDQARSYGMGLVVANQRLRQLSPSMASALQANARSKVVFQLDHEQARQMEGDFKPLDKNDLTQLDKYEVAAQLMTPTGIAPVVTVATFPAPYPSGYGNAAQRASQAVYGRSVAEVEADWQARHRVDMEERKRPAIGRVVEP